MRQLHSIVFEALNSMSCSVMVPSYDDPILWEGHGSMVQEAAKQLPAKPAAIFCSVGGGGLLGGIIVGCAQVGWEDGT